jgi:hypothetical protein
MAIAKHKAVAWKIRIEKLTSCGVATRSACGRTTVRKADGLDSPMLAAASRWPSGTDRKAVRKISLV